MAFTGVPSFRVIGPNIVRILGLSVAGGASGTIGLNGDSGVDVQLPATFNPQTPPPGAALDLTDLIECRIHPDDAGGAQAAHWHQTQTASPFRITLTNDLVNPTGGLDIYIQYFHSMVR